MWPNRPLSGRKHKCGLWDSDGTGSNPDSATAWESHLACLQLGFLLENMGIKVIPMIMTQLYIQNS